ncbi:MAG: baseplate J/gp47 family protein [Acutalibacteraceae bacterium]
MNKLTFVSSDTSEILNELIADYEEKTGHILNAADPERLFLAWVADFITRERVNQNFIGNQNIPSCASGEYLDALCEWIYSIERNPAQAAKCTVRFTIVEAQDTSIAIPSGTRVTDNQQSLVWATTEDAVIPIGETSVDVMVQCETDGNIGNDYAPGKINTLVDIDNILYFASCQNITASDGGAEEETDESYFERARLSLDGYSTAGSKGSYAYHAKAVSNEIADVKVVRPGNEQTATLPLYSGADNTKYAFIGGDYINPQSVKVFANGSETPCRAGSDYTQNYIDGLLTLAIEPDSPVATQSSVRVSFSRENAGKVNLYAITNDGEKASDTMKEAIFAACNDDYVRPLTDRVEVLDPAEKRYDISIKYFVSTTAQSSISEIQTAVTEAVNQYISWQCAKLGRDINPSQLLCNLMHTGVKRVEISSPVFTVLESGENGGTPELAKIGNVSIVNGGYEDE